MPIHEWELRNLNVQGVYYLYNDNLKKEDYKSDSTLRENRNSQYRPYFIEVRYNVAEGNLKLILTESSKVCLPIQII